jgi:hypothetical protein
VLFANSSSFKFDSSLAKFLHALFNVYPSDVPQLLFFKNTVVAYGLLNTYFSVSRGQGPPIRILWTPPASIFINPEAMTKHYKHLSLQYTLLDGLIMVLLKYWRGRNISMSKFSDLVKQQDINRSIPGHVLDQSISAIFTHFVQIGIRTTSSLIFTRFRLYAMNPLYRTLNDGIPLYKIPPLTDNTLLNIYFKLSFVNSLPFDSGHVLNKTVPLHTYSDQYKYQVYFNEHGL